MADFDEFLIAEFNEQHNNMRQIESSMTQMIQGFFSIEGIVLAGALSLLSINFTANQIVGIMAPIFWFLFLFGHITYNITIYSFVNILIIDFQNTVARKYFGKKYSNEEYLYFMLNPEVESGGKEGDWEKVKDNRSAIAKFVGTVNTVNLTIAFLTTIYATIKFLSPQFDFMLLSTMQLVIIIFISVIIFFVAQKVYHWAMFLRLVRREEKITLQRRKELLKRISRDKLSPKVSSVKIKAG